MTKIETVKSLNDSEPQLLIVESVRTLEETVTLMQKDLKILPAAVANETTNALRPLTVLQEEVNGILAHFDKLTNIQRQSLNELSQEISRRATLTFAQKASKLDKTIADLTGEVARTKRITQQIGRLPQELTSTTRNMITAANLLTRSTAKAFPKWWVILLMAIIAGSAGAIMTMTGHAAFKRLLTANATQRQARQFQTLWKNATPKEQEWMRKIYFRPAK